MLGANHWTQSKSFEYTPKDQTDNRDLKQVRRRRPAWTARTSSENIASRSCNNKEFKIYDATVAKTSLKIASSRFSIYSVIMSVCLTFESSRNYPGTEVRVAVSTLEKNTQICA